MKVSELTADYVALFAKIDEDAEDRMLLCNLFLPAAKAYMRSQTGMTDEEMDEHEDIPIAICALCSQMYDNRSVEIASDKLNPVVADIIGRYDKNLIPRSEST